MVKEIGTLALEAALAQAATGPKGRFSLSDLLRLLEIDADDAESREVWSNRLRRELSGSPDYFVVPGGDEYVSREVFFRGAAFLITPSEWEIESGILMVGHRVAPFCHGEIFPSEIQVHSQDRSWQAAWKRVELPLETIAPLHMLIGLEELADYLIADCHANRAVLRRFGDKANAVVSIHVIDMAAYYAEHEFEFGDALAMTVESYRDGVFSCTYLDGRERSSAAVRTWCELLEAQVDKVIEMYADTLSIPDQLREAFFLDGRSLLVHSGGSLDEFYSESKDLEIDYDRSEQSCLVRRSARQLREDLGEGDEAVEVPDGFGISTGAVDSLESLLKELGIVLTLVELDSFAFDQLAQGVTDFDAWFARIFGEATLPFADEAQEVVFFNTLEERFEVLSESYDRAGDADRTELRSQILELVENRLSFLRTMHALEVAADQAPEELWRRLTECSMYLNNVLDLLNAPGEALDFEQAEKLSDAIDNMGAAQEEALEELRSKLNMPLE